MKKLSFTVVFLFTLIFIPKIHIYAETLSIQYPYGDNNIINGDILSLKDGKVYKTDYNNIQSIVGIASINNTLFPNKKNYTNVIEKGIQNVYVSNLNGNIEIGNNITASNIKGIGSLLLNKGISIGEALVSFNIKNAKRYKNTNIYIEKIPVSINIGYINYSTGVNNISPLSYIEGININHRSISFDQLIAIVIVLFSAVLSAMIIMIRGARNTIIKTGRNPLNEFIMKNFYKTALFSIIIIIIGIFICYIILLL